MRSMATPGEPTGDHSTGGEARGSPDPTITRPAGPIKVLGQLHEFRPELEQFTVYLERVQNILHCERHTTGKRYPYF